MWREEGFTIRFLCVLEFYTNTQEEMEKCSDILGIFCLFQVGPRRTYSSFWQNYEV